MTESRPSQVVMGHSIGEAHRPSQQHSTTTLHISASFQLRPQQPLAFGASCSVACPRDEYTRGHSRLTHHPPATCSSVLSSAHLPLLIESVGFGRAVQSGTTCHGGPRRRPCTCKVYCTAQTRRRPVTVALKHSTHARSCAHTTSTPHQARRATPTAIVCAAAPTRTGPTAQTPSRSPWAGQRVAISLARGRPWPSAGPVGGV